MNDHNVYAVLCTLAATGQLSTSERADFDEHCLHCAACRDQRQELICIGMQLQLDGASHATSGPMPIGSLERFRVRVVREGIAPRSAPARPSASYAIAMAATIFVVVALAFVPHGRKPAETFATSAVTVERIPSRESLSASDTERSHVPRHSRAVPTRSPRHVLVPHTDVGVYDTNLTSQRFPQAIVASYAFFGSESTAKSSATGYPALSRSQMSRLDFFRSLDDLDSRSDGGLATVRPVDIASTGNAFDFSAHIRQLHFQLSSAQ